MLSKLSDKLEGLLTIQQMAWMLLILGVLDAALTDLGLRTGFVHEANPIVKYIYTLDPLHLSFYLIKTVLPFLVVLSSNRVKNSLIVLPSFLLATGAYMIITFFHMIWITFYLHILIR